jgi:hypothetical protein
MPLCREKKEITNWWDPRRIMHVRNELHSTLTQQGLVIAHRDWICRSQVFLWEAMKHAPVLLPCHGVPHSAAVPAGTRRQLWQTEAEAVTQDASRGSKTTYVQITLMGYLLPTLGSVWEPPSFPTASRSVTPLLNSRTSLPGSGTSTASMSVSSAVEERPSRPVGALSAPVSCRPVGTTGKIRVTSRTMSPLYLPL